MKLGLTFCDGVEKQSKDILEYLAVGISGQQAPHSGNAGRAPTESPLEVIKIINVYYLWACWACWMC